MMQFKILFFADGWAMDLVLFGIKFSIANAGGVTSPPNGGRHSTLA